MQLSQQGRQWRERKCPIFETVAKGIRSRAHLIASFTTHIPRPEECCSLKRDSSLFDQLHTHENRVISIKITQAYATTFVALSKGLNLAMRLLTKSLANPPTYIYNGLIDRKAKM